MKLRLVKQKNNSEPQKKEANFQCFLNDAFFYKYINQRELFGFGRQLESIA